MSNDPKNNPNTEKTKTVKFQVSTSDKEKELIKEKETLITDRAKLQKELEDLKKEYEGKVDELKKATEDLEATATQRDDLSQKFTTLAIKRFNAEKKAILDRAKEVVDDETFKDIESRFEVKENEKQIDVMNRFEQTKWMVEKLITGLEKVKNPSEEGGETNPPANPPTSTANPDNIGSGGSGSAELKPKPTETSDLLKREFDSPREMVDYLFDRATRGKVITREIQVPAPDGKGTVTKVIEERIGPDKEAEEMITKLWEKWADTTRKEMRGKNTWVMCWKCKGMYDLRQGTCPLCKVSLTKGPESDGVIKRR